MLVKPETPTLSAEIFRVCTAENLGCLMCDRVENYSLSPDVFVGVSEVEDFPGEYRDIPVFFAQLFPEDASIDLFTVACDGGIGAYIDTLYLMV